MRHVQVRYRARLRQERFPELLKGMYAKMLTAMSEVEAAAVKLLEEAGVPASFGESAITQLRVHAGSVASTHPRTSPSVLDNASRLEVGRPHRLQKCIQNHVALASC
jgi:hypothetical protein